MAYFYLPSLALTMFLVFFFLPSVAVIALKKSCDEETAAYNSIFELAKYVLVSHSSVSDSDPKAKHKRTQIALKRIKKRNSWSKKLQMENIDPHAALVEIEKECPAYFVNQYTTDTEGRVVVAYHNAFAPLDFVTSGNENVAKYLAAEQYRLDLAAADMEEARRGISMVSITDGKLTTKRA